MTRRVEELTRESGKGSTINHLGGRGPDFHEQNFFFCPKPPTHPNPNVVRILKSVGNIGPSLTVYKVLQILSVMYVISRSTSHYYGPC